MAKPGQIIHNPATNETIKFLRTAAETNGELLQFEDTMPASQPGVPAHLHAYQTETFTVLNGVFQVRIAGVAQRLTVGESVTIGAGVPHSFHTKASEGVTVLVELRPALDTEIFFETMAVAATQQRSIPLHIAVMAQELQLGFYLAGIPKPVQDLLFATLAPLARRLGYRACY